MAWTKTETSKIRRLGNAALLKKLVTTVGVENRDVVGGTLVEPMQKVQGWCMETL
jgi:hypothetical protein